MAYNKPDTHVARHRKKRHNIVTDTFVKNFNKTYPRWGTTNKVKFNEILWNLHEKMWKVAVETREGVELPEGLGYIFVGSCLPPKKFVIDCKKSYENGVLVKHRNFETDNRLAKIIYHNYSVRYKFPLREIWTFTACRKFKKAVVKSFRENWTMYTSMDNRKASHMIRPSVMRALAKRLNSSKYLPENYNEFAL